MTLFCLLATFARAACGSGKDLAGVETIGVTYADGQLLGSSIFTGEHRIIPLSAPTADAQIREVERVMFARDRIFVMDRRGNKVLAFDGSGRFVASTAPLMGRGHNEYIRVIDATVDCDSGLVYAFCDAPYCVMVLDFNLRLKRKTDLGFYLSEVAQDSRYVYGLQRSGEGKTGSRIVAIDKRRPESAPRTVLQTEKGVMGVLTTAGKSLTNFGDTVLACLPHDNIVYMLHDGKEVGAFGVHHVHPPGQLAAAVVVAQVQVAHHDDARRPAYVFMGAERQRSAHFVAVVGVAVGEQPADDNQQRRRHGGVGMEPGARHHVQQAPRVEQQEGHDNIKQDEDKGVARLVAGRGQPQRHSVDGAREVEQRGEERQGAHRHRAPPPRRSQRQQAPHVPQRIGQAQDGQHKEQYHPHFSLSVWFLRPLN